jgi:phage terminase large subunit
VGIDWGYTNPAAILLILKDRDNHFWITDEYYKTQKTTTDIVEYALSLRGEGYYPDPAEPDRNEELRRAGANVREVSKDIEAGINAVRELFKQNRLHISSSCVHLINELETYRYPERKPEKNEPEVPVKENDHLLDATRYCLYMNSAYKDPDLVSVNIPDYD